MPRLSETALKRLDDASARLDELARELSDPGTFGDARRAADLGREQAELAPVVDSYSRYRRLVGHLDEAEGLLRDGVDEEMKTLAQEEIAAIEPRLQEVNDGLQELLRPSDANDGRAERL